MAFSFFMPVGFAGILRQTPRQPQLLGDLKSQTLEIYELESQQHLNFWQFRPSRKIFLLPQIPTTLNSDLLLQIESCHLIASWKNFGRELWMNMILMSRYIKSGFIFWPFLTLSIPAPSERCMIFLPKSPAQVQTCWLSLWWKNYEDRKNVNFFKDGFFSSEELSIELLMKNVKPEVLDDCLFWNRSL